ncbi:MAG: glutamine-synthetase adenylyltransferase, partial [Sphingomonadales bacterium]
MGRAKNHSPFLSLLLDRETQLAVDLPAAMQDPLAAARDLAGEMDEAARLRLERRRLALLVALGDLAGVFDLTRVTHLLTDFADDALNRAIRTAIAERTPDADPVGFAAIALGKQGSRELNYSSDIDPILLFDPDTLPRRPREEPVEAAVRIGRRVVDLLQTRDGNGYVMRVDLRLRPSPEATPIVLPVEAAISYYESQALPWERAAFIRSRACAGDLALGGYFLDAVRPFVWRRGLDYGTIREIRDISRRIRDHYAQAQAFGPGYDLKRGRGGIREVEFFAQIHQLIHGGRDPALRAPATRDALAALAAAGRIEAEDAAALSEAYTVFRTIEHRLQMVDDLQTHRLPRDPAALANVAALHGLGGSEALLDLLRPRTDRVGHVYDLLSDDAEPRLPASSETLQATLAEAGFDHPAGAARIVEGWRGGGYPALRTSQAREALEAVLPGLIAAFAQAPDSTHAITRFDAMLSRLPSAINFFRLLEAQPALARLLSAVLCHAPTLAEQLGRRAQLLDGLIDATALDPMPAMPALIAEMAACETGVDYQWQLDHVRKLVGEKRFALGAQIVSGTSDPLEVSAGYARVARPRHDLSTQSEALLADELAHVIELP